LVFIFSFFLSIKRLVQHCKGVPLIWIEAMIFVLLFVFCFFFFFCLFDIFTKFARIWQIRNLLVFFFLHFVLIVHDTFKFCYFFYLRTNFITRNLRSQFLIKRGGVFLSSLRIEKKCIRFNIISYQQKFARLGIFLTIEKSRRRTNVIFSLFFWIWGNLFVPLMTRMMRIHVYYVIEERIYSNTRTHQKTNRSQNYSFNFAFHLCKHTNFHFYSNLEKINLASSLLNCLPNCFSIFCFIHLRIKSAQMIFVYASNCVCFFFSLIFVFYFLLF